MELLKNLEGMSADEQMTAVVELQKAAMKQLEEQKQVSIGKSAEMVIQGLKKIKSDFEAKFDSLNYDIQAKVANLKDGQPGIQGPKGDQGDRGLDGANGRDGRDGKDGQDGLDGVDGIGVRDAKIDFDGSLVISLTDGREINCGEVVSVDVAKQIQKVTHNIQTGAGGDSQTVLDAIAALQATIATYGTMATQNANNVAITGGTINNTVIGGTTPAAGTFTTLIGGGGSANYFQTQGSETTKAVEAKALGSDTNIAFVIDSKGTGAIDLAAGSSGVNISNGGTVTALTRTTSAFNYTSQPTLAISAPTTAGGVQATAVQHMYINTAPVTSGGTGYTVGNVLTVVGGTPVTTAATLTVSTVSAGVITGVTSTNFNLYSALPSSPVSVTGGTGSGATFSPNWGNANSFTITNAGSGYVEQPTVTFSGGGGSGAAAYASVGSSTVIKTLGSTATTSGISFQTPAGEQVRITDSGNTAVNYIGMWGGSSGVAPRFVARGTDTDVSLLYSVKGAGNHVFRTNDANQTQFQVSHTASAVNYVQVTGAATGGQPNITAQGSDASIGLTYRTKGNFNHQFQNGSFGIGFEVAPVASTANYLRSTSAATTVAPALSAQGSDTNIDLTLTPKGTGNVRFGTYTGTISAITGYIEIKDSGGTVRRLAVVA
jgi:hypothetical protein